MGSVTVISKITNIPLSTALGGIFSEAADSSGTETCWKYEVTAKWRNVGEYWSKTEWCAIYIPPGQGLGKITRDPVLSDQITKVELAYANRGSDIDTTGGGKGHHWHEDTGKAKFEHCPWIPDDDGVFREECSGWYEVLQIVKYVDSQGTGKSNTSTYSEKA